ncbi:hypothetical protein K502DRAFT_338366 [Neoconidiobolus thromboides FSU 785]|nr:hypothetical protein K502DRAFT_338366 [Neoconidiobolus thromboides FSU 785]
MSDIEDSIYDERKRTHDEDDEIYNTRDYSYETTRNVKRPTLNNTEKETREKVFSFRCLLNVKESGVIIGRHGKSISELRDNSRAKIQISDSVPGSSERILTVTGDSRNVAKAFKLLAEHIPFELEKERSRLAIYSFRLLMPHMRMGVIIGKGGSTIKEMQDRTRARLSANEEILPQSTERILSVSGSPNNVEAGILEICRVLRELPERSSGVIYYKPTSQSSINEPSSSNDNTFSHQNFMASDSTFGDDGSGKPPTHIQQLYIPNEMVGCIIGKGGNKINEIRMLSGANIKVADQPTNSNERLVTILGTPECNGLALNLLYTRLETEKVKVFKEINQDK